MFPGSKVPAARQERMRREKLSMTAWTYALVPSTSRMSVVSMYQISFGFEARMPIFGFVGCTRIRGRRQPRSRTSRRHVVADAKTRPRR